jgi:hypothetical protein
MNKSDFEYQDDPVFDDAYLYDDDYDGEYGVNEAVIYFERPDFLVIGYGDGRSVGLELKDTEEQEKIKSLLADPNFWANFVTALSGALAHTR